ncbi:MAG: 2Fe-2S iron-sulfur cluster-binding protein [Spirochaetales bacterium]|uniref:2Fe-2S iron-sulfur cluster-binding protein n=1 Tax=Candidatus Thalassospirochaeta sargassi TaxID=3119039 RepID=A0AAJ1IJ56_9SPIO|nr:2Fe-2S iron-sulfur cluster-binding protein [Spirochaetales bacterium]
MKIDFSLNGKKVSIDTLPEKRLIDVIREDFGLMTTKNACYSGECGSCTVQLEGRIVPACQIPIFTVRAKRIVTIEGFMGTEKYLDIINAFNDIKCIPCPFCFTGKILAVDSLIDNHRTPDTSDIMALLSDHSCSCTSVSKFIEGVRMAYHNREFRGELLK